MKKQISNIPFSFKEQKVIYKDDDPLLKLFLLTGIRRFELKNLLLAKKQGGVRIVKGKGKKQRIIPTNKIIEKLLKECQKWATFSDRYVGNYFLKKGIVFGFKNNPHRYRATFATNLLNEGVNLITIQTLMGHSAVNMTAEYIKINTFQLKQAIELLTHPNRSLDGMTPPEMKQEIITLRARLNKILEKDIEDKWI